MEKRIRKFKQEMKQLFFLGLGFIAIITIWPFAKRFVSSFPLHGKYVLVNTYSEELGKYVFDRTTPVEIEITTMCIKFKYYLDMNRCVMFTDQCGLHVDSKSILHTTYYNTKFSDGCHKENISEDEVIEYVYRKENNKLYLTNPEMHTTDIYAEN
jgi:hypothetical protein